MTEPTDFQRFMKQKYGPNWQITCTNSKIRLYMGIFFSGKASGQAELFTLMLTLKKRTWRGRIFGTLRIKKFLRMIGQ